MYEEDLPHSVPDPDNPLLTALSQLVGRPLYAFVMVGDQPLAAIHAALVRVETLDADEWVDEACWLHFDENPLGTRLAVAPQMLTAVEWDQPDQLRIETDLPVRIKLIDRSTEARVAHWWRTLRRARADKRPSGQRVYGFFVELLRNEHADSEDPHLRHALAQVLDWATSDEPPPGPIEF